MTDLAEPLIRAPLARGTVPASWYCTEQGSSYGFDVSEFRGYVRTPRGGEDVSILLSLFPYERDDPFSRGSLVVGWVSRTERGHHHERAELVNGRQKLVQQSLSGVHC